MSPVQLTVDKEFESLIAPLSDLEFAQLKDNILQDGCQEPLSVWRIDGKTVLLDGHNRYNICTENRRGFQTINIKLDSRDHAKLWILQHQVGRRNLTDDQRSVIWNDIREQRSAIARKDRAETARAAQTNPRLSDKVTDKPKQDTRKETAQEARLPERKLRAVQVLKAKTPELVEQVRAGKMTLSQAKHQAFKAEISARKVEHAADAPVSQLSAFVQHANKFYVATILGEKLGAEIRLLLALDRRPTGVEIGCKELAKTLRKIADMSVKYAEALEAVGTKS